MNKTVPVVNQHDYTLYIEDLTHDGAGVAKVDGYPLFIAGALPGETVRAKVTKVNKGYGFAKLLDIVERSADRIEPPCTIYSECGGCQLQHLSYEGQLKAKRKHVQDVMTRIAKIDAPVHETLGMATPWRYRNKAQVPVGTDGKQLIAGFFRKRTHDIIDMDTCLIQHEENDDILRAVKQVCTKHGIPPYNEEKHKGVLRHVMVRIGKTTGDAMIVLVTRTDELPHKQAIIADILAAVPTIKSIVQNVNNKKTNVIMGDTTRVLWGDEYIYDYIGDVKFAISARSFYQVNPEQTKVLYDKALEYAQLTGKETVIDAYCGIGSISLCAATKAKKVYGVEIVKEAIEDARRNADLNGFTNAEFEVGAAEVVIPNWYKAGIRADVIIVDPPRKGCDEALLETIIAMKPERVVYVSCNHATLARDLRILEDGGFVTKDITPVDMFPMTTHVECVAWMERVEE